MGIPMYWARIFSSLLRSASSIRLRCVTSTPIAHVYQPGIGTSADTFDHAIVFSVPSLHVRMNSHSLSGCESRLAEALTGG